METLQLNNIDDIIQAYESDLINTDALFHILEKCMPLNIAVWSDANGYVGTKAETIKSLLIYKSFLESGAEVPLFFFPSNESKTSNEYEFSLKKI
jgi:hypothetical protein